MPVRLAFIGGRGEGEGKKKKSPGSNCLQESSSAPLESSEAGSGERESLGGAWVLAKGVPAGAHKGRGLHKGTRRNPDLR